MPGANVRGSEFRSPRSGDRGDVARVPPVGETEPLDTRTPGVDASALGASRLTVSEDGPPVLITRRRVLVAGVLIVVGLVGVYFLIPKLAGLGQTWGRLRRGDPLWLAAGAALELLSIAGYAILFRTVFGRGVLRIDWLVSVEIPLAGIAAIRLVAAAGAGGVAVTVWALRRAGMSAPVIACRMVASLVVQYSVYLGAVIVCGLGLWAGLFSGGGSVALTIVPAAIAAVLVAAVFSLALLPRDLEQRLERVASGPRASRSVGEAAREGAGHSRQRSQDRRRAGLRATSGVVGGSGVLGVRHRCAGCLLPCVWDRRAGGGPRDGLLPRDAG